ncbi:MAG: TonB-dependent receptor [Fidelibacterota bacterium]
MNRINTSLLYILLCLFPVAAMAQGTITGTVTDSDGSAVVGANVFLDGTNMGDATDANGDFTIADVPAGGYTIIASAIGYKTGKDAIVITDGVVTASFTLGTDILGMDAVVITGVLNPTSKLESSVAISTADAVEISQRAPRNTADLLKYIPGFYVESSGGEGGNNLFTRGIPADGSFRYVSVQEDGMPVFNAPECMFFNVDLAVRMDENIQRMESVRGGSGSILASNAAGGIINYISKTGGAKFGGSAKFTTGDYGMYRTDLEFGGPLGENIRYHMGGFYRTDQGIRPTGFTANQGGQIKGNLTYLMDKGYIRLYGKYLNDRNVFYLPVPLSGLDEELEGFDANYGTMTSLDLLYLNVRKPEGRGYQEQYLDDGMHPTLYTVGSELSYELSDNLLLRNKMKRSVLDHQFNAIFSLNDPSLAGDYATAAGVTDPVWSYVRGEGAGDTISDISNLNGNGLVVDVGWWAVTMPMNDFANDLSLTRSLGSHDVTLGYWFSYDKQEAHWWWHNVLMEIAENPRALDLLDSDTGIYYTDNGFSKYGSMYLNYEFTNFVNAFYLNDEFTIGDMTINAGLRSESGTINGMTENTQNYDMADTTTMADDAVLYGDGTYGTWGFEYDELAWSVGLNYKMSDNMAVFGRASNGFRAPDDNNLVFSKAEGSRVEDISQFEIGGKYNSPNLATFATFFYSTLNDFPFGDEVVGDDGSITNLTRYADAIAMGTEIELIAKLGNIGLNFTGTVQDITYRDYVFTIGGVTTDFEGKQVRRIPKIFFTLMPSYTMGDLFVNVTIQHFGDRFTDDANTESAKLPGFIQFNAGATYQWGDLAFSVNATNLTNTIGLTEGNPRTESVLAGEKSFRMARPIMGRSLIASLAYNF